MPTSYGFRGPGRPCGRHNRDSVRHNGREAKRKVLTLTMRKDASGEWFIDDIVVNDV